MIDIAKAWHSAEMISTAKAGPGEESKGKGARTSAQACEGMARQIAAYHSNGKAKRGQ